MITPHHQTSPNRTVFSVTELNRAVATLLESEFSWTWVEGEISNLAKPASGHIYFTLKDSGAQIRCAMFKSRTRDLKFKPENGQKVLLRGKVSLYAARGDYQIIVDKMDEAGDGALQQQFEALKLRLSQEGLFDQDKKQEIPEHPGTIGIITSRSGAALHDVLSVIQRRFPLTPVKLFPVPVQGVEAAPAICNAIIQMDKHHSCDVLLLVRGGGSLEDLWAFNEESVARAIYACTIPIISGIGHEIDFTIADFVADLRAATPTAAAETVTADQEALLQTTLWYGQRITQLLNEKIESLGILHNHLKKRLEQQHPSAVLDRLSQRLDDLSLHMHQAWKVYFQQKTSQLLQTKTRLLAESPEHRLTHLQQQLANYSRQLPLSMNNHLHQHKLKLSNFASTLNALSPLQTLCRGYSVTYDASGQALTNASGLETGDTIKTRLYKSNIISVIKDISE